MNEQLFYAQEINSDRLFGVVDVSKLGKITESTSKEDWLKMSKKHWEQTDGIRDSNFDVDFELVAVA